MTEITDSDDKGPRHGAFSYRLGPTVPPFPDDRPLIVFDGDCGLCAGTVQFVLRHDARAVFRFAPAQSALGTALYRHYGLDPVQYDTFIVLEAGRPYLKSAGALRLVAGLGLPWSLLGILRLLPASLRDALYDLVARHRLRWFGRPRSCALPAAGHVERFLG